MKKPYGIEMRYPESSLDALKAWHAIKWYVTEARRDQALAQLKRKRRVIFNGKDRLITIIREYRPVERD